MYQKTYCLFIADIFFQNFKYLKGQTWEVFSKLKGQSGMGILDDGSIDDLKTTKLNPLQTLILEIIGKGSAIVQVLGCQI